MNKTATGNCRGQALTEYLILIALLGIGSMAVVQILGRNLQVRIADVSDAIRGEKVKREGTKVENEHIKVKDLGDFSDAITDTSQK